MLQPLPFYEEVMMRVDLNEPSFSAYSNLVRRQGISHHLFLWQDAQVVHLRQGLLIRHLQFADSLLTIHYAHPVSQLFQLQPCGQPLDLLLNCCQLRAEDEAVKAEELNRLEEYHQQLDWLSD